MKTFADILAARPHPRDEVARRVAGRLKRPSKNHSDWDMPSIERFVFNQSACEAVEAMFASSAARAAAFDNLNHPPLPAFISAIDRGFLIEKWAGKVHIIMFAKTNDTELRGKHVIEAGTVYFTDINPHDLPYIPGPISGSCAHHEDQHLTEFIRGGIDSLVYLLAALTQPHMATVERIHPATGGSAANRIAARRAMQRGKPMYSFNTVSINLPKHSRQGGEIAGSQAFTPRRGHNVIGHWRLITRSEEPYFVWVQPHQAGDPALGWVTKERIIKIKGGVRHGYLMPEFAGQNGQRVDAIPSP